MPTETLKSSLWAFFAESLNFRSISTQCLFRPKGVYLNYGETLSDLPAAIAVTPNKYIERTINITPAMRRCIYSDFAGICFLIASKLSSLITCSMRHASSTAIFSSTPSVVSHFVRSVWRSYILFAISLPFSVSSM